MNVWDGSSVAMSDCSSWDGENRVETGPTWSGESTQCGSIAEKYDRARKDNSIRSK